MKSYKDLIVWQKSIDLTILIYKITEKFPKEEVYGLVSQMRRASVSIPSNIVEGRCRSTKKDYRQFLRVALGSCAELETQLIISRRLEKTSTFDYSSIDSLLEEIMKMLSSLIGKLAPNT